MAIDLLKYMIWKNGTGGGKSYEKTVGPAPILSISDAKAKPAKSLVVGMEPIQAGSGDPSPDNIRPISGRTGVTVERKGVNFWNVNAITPTAARITVTKTDDGYQISSDATSNLTVRAVYGVLPAGMYAISLSTTNENGQDVDTYLMKDGSVNTKITSGGITFTADGATEYGFLFFWTVGSGVNTVSNIMLNAGSTVLPYKPYVGASYPITWQSEAGTVYGGTVDVVSGEGSVIGQRITADSSKLTRVARNNADTGTVYRTDAAVGGINMNLFSDHGILASESLQISSSANAYMPVYSVKLYTNYLYICIPDDDIDAAKAWATANPVNVVATLKDPIPFTLTPTQIQLLKGSNVLWSDADDLTLTYLAKKG